MYGNSGEVGSSLSESATFKVKEMAESKTVAVVPLNGSNYVTWRIQCKMALMKENLWKVIDGTEAAPGEDDAGYMKFLERRDRALAIVVLSIDPSLLYLIGEPTDPKVVWEKKKSWGNRLELRRRLHTMRLREGDSIQVHIKQMTEVFDALSVIEAPVSQEDRSPSKLARLFWGVGYCT